MLKPLAPPDSMHLEAAEGWLELGNHLEANEELERIQPQLRVHPDVLEVRYEVYSRACKWAACVDIADAIVKMTPDCRFGWIHRSYALHVLRRTVEAYEYLFPVADKFPDCWTVPYNLACYCAQLGRIPEAEMWFQKAVAIEPDTVRKAGLDDPDLEPLWKA
jgi:tetratricopeptide (TPR) repeat protein